MSRIPLWLAQTAMLVGIYVALMYVLTLWMPVWHDWDWRFFQWISSSQTPTISPLISLVDLRSWNPADKPADRRLVARFLHQLVASNQRPQAVILDIDFGPCQSEECTDRTYNAARSALKQSLNEAAQARVDVYAAESLVAGRADLADDVSGIDAHDPEIYAVLAGTAHTLFTPVSGSNGLFFRACYEVPRTDQHGATIGGDTQAVWAMAFRVGPNFDVTKPCDAEHLPVLMGAKMAPLDRTGHAIMLPPNYSVSNDSAFPSGAVFERKYIVVGTVRCDRPATPNVCAAGPDTENSDRSGSELVAWALSGVLEGGGPSKALRASPQNEMLLLLVPAFSALAVLAFTAWYFLLRRLPLGGMRRFLPWVAAALALGVGLAIFAGFEFLMLHGGEIQPQVTLISLGMVLSAGLCGVRGNQIEFAQLYALDDSPPVEKNDYDVFISYAHDEGAWVYEHVYTPFRDARLPNGEKLSIFFDTADIRGGTAWQSKISLAVNGSRFIVPVYSEVYFSKPYCRFEISRAHRKWINAGEASRCVLPVMRGHPKILEAVDDIQGISIDDQSDIVEQYVREIVARLSTPVSLEAHS